MMCAAIYGQNSAKYLSKCVKGPPPCRGPPAMLPSQARRGPGRGPRWLARPHTGRAHGQQSGPRAVQCASSGVEEWLIPGGFSVLYVVLLNACFNAVVHSHEPVLRYWPRPGEAPLAFRPPSGQALFQECARQVARDEHRWLGRLKREVESERALSLRVRKALPYLAYRQRVAYACEMPLFQAIKADHVPVVEELLQAGFRLDLVARPDSTTPLMHAAQVNSISVLRWLLKEAPQARASLGKRDIHGLTALHHAAKAGNVLCYEELLRHGADRHAANEGGKTPLDLKDW